MAPQLALVGDGNAILSRWPIVDDRKITASGVQITCRECGHKWKVGQARPDRTTAPIPAPQPPTVRTQSGPVPAVSAAASAGSVECPSCHHRFVPSSTGPQKAAAPRGTASGPQPVAQAAGQKRRVLLVEDQNYFYQLTSEALGER